MKARLAVNIDSTQGLWGIMKHSSQGKGAVMKVTNTLGVKIPSRSLATSG